MEASSKKVSLTSPFKSDALKGQVCLIVGGGTGICFGIAQIFGRHGAKLALMGRRENVLQEACQKLKSENIEAIGVQGDVRQFKDAERVVAKVVEHYGKLDTLINGAAGNFLCSAEDLTANAFQTVIGIDLIGTYHMSKASLGALKKSKGNIVNISATLHYGATFYQTHASAAKAGVDSLTRSLALEWGPFQIRVNGVAPGPIANTEGMNRLSGGRTEPPPDSVFERIPLRRYGEVEEIGYACLFLSAQVAAAYISGTTIVVDGGMCLAQPQMIPPEVYAFIAEERKQAQSQKAKL
jgi:peroxisomal 2,4-dienoyl-CoA reductase